MEESFWLEEAWVPYAIEDIQYSDDGLPIVVERVDGEGKIREMFSYDDRGWAIESITQIWMDNQWLNQTREKENYDGNDYMGYTVEEWVDGVWVMEEGMRYVYQKDGELVEVLIIQIKRPEEEWINMQRYTYAYVGSSNTVASFIIESWEGEQWVNSMKIDYTYGDDTIEFLYFNYNDGAWTVTSKMIETKGDNDSFYYTNYSLVDGDWVAGSKTSYEFDSHGNATLFLIEFYNGGWEAYMGDKYILDYDGNNLLQRITQHYTINWVNALKEVFSDFHTAGITTSLNDNFSFQTFPNPVNDMLFVKASNPGGAEDVQITIYSITGQETTSKSYTLRNGTQQLSIPVDLLKRGAYILRIQDKLGRTVLNEIIQIY